MPFSYAPTTSETMNIQSNSPFKVFFPSTEYGTYTGGLTEATLNLWVYTGAQGDSNTFVSGNNVDASIAGASGGRPNTPTKILKSTAVGEVNAEFVSFDIANIVKSFIKQEFTGQDVTNTALVNPDVTVWVDYQLTTKVGNATTIQPLFRGLGFDGYTYFEEGVNAQVAEFGALISADTVSIIEEEDLHIPILLGEVTNVTFYYADNTVCGAESYPTVPTISYNQIKYPVCMDADYVTIVTDSSARTISINKLECNKHTPYKLSFVNRFGAIESLWFNGNNTESVSNKSKEYSRVVTSSANGSEYSTAKGSRYKQRLSSNKAMTLNSGFYPEACNVSFEELMDSNEVWIHKDGIILPVNIKTSSLNKKTELNDNAINYTINIEYAFNKINNI